MTPGVRMGQPAAAPSLLRPACLPGSGRRLQLICAGPAGAAEKAGAPAPRCLGWIHRGWGNPPTSPLGPRPLARGPGSMLFLLMNYSLPVCLWR